MERPLCPCTKSLTSTYTSYKIFCFYQRQFPEEMLTFRRQESCNPSASHLAPPLRVKYPEKKNKNHHIDNWMFERYFNSLLCVKYMGQPQAANESYQCYSNKINGRKVCRHDKVLSVCKRSRETHQLWKSSKWISMNKLLIRQATTRLKVGFNFSKKN